MIDIKFEERLFAPSNVIYLDAVIPNNELFIPFNTLSYFIKLPLHLFDQGLDPSAASGETWMTLLSRDDSQTETRVSMPVSVKVPEGNGVFYQELPQRKLSTVTAYHKGPRHDLEEVYQQTLSQIQAWGLELGEEAPFINFVNNKHMVVESELLTELVFPVKGGVQDDQPA